MNRRDVLVLVGICVPACALCMPVIRQNRDAAARIGCANNLKQIGLALHNYAGSFHGRLPGMHALMFPWQRPSEGEFHKQVSWLYDISPFVEARMDPKLFLDPAKPIDSEENRFAISAWFPVYLCPVNPNKSTVSNLTNYVGITGVGRDAALLPLTDPRCGFFGVAPRFIDKSIKDGTSVTLAIIETATDNGPWALSGHYTVRGLDPDGGHYLGDHGQFNSYHGQGVLFRQPSAIANACFADASVRGLSANLSPAVFEALATIAGGEQIPLDW